MMPTMNAATLGLLAGALLILTTLAACAPEATRSYTPPPQAKPALLLTSKSLQLTKGDPMRFDVAFTNQGAEPFTILQPIDGAADGMRCVRYEWVVERTDKAPIQGISYGRCGNTNPITPKDFAVVPAGATHPITGGWLSGPDQKLDCSAPGTYRVKLKYSFTAPKERFDPKRPSIGRGAGSPKADAMLSDVAEITLESNWVEITRQ